jgi:DNA polymerase-1
MAKTLYIIDGHSQIYRAYYAPFRDLTSPTGEPTRATYVFCSMLFKLIQERKPDYLAMALDGPTAKLHRRELYPDYKITRKPMPEDLPVQIERIVEIVRCMGIPLLEKTGYEADDIIATAASRLADDDLEVFIVSRDKDLDQILTERVRLYDPMKDEVIDPPSLVESKGYPPSQAVEIQALTGDTSDNVPGVPGVGPKTAVKLIAKYGSAREVVRHADEQTPKLSENLKAHAEQVELSRKLVTLDRQTPIELTLEEMKFEGVSGQIRPLLGRLGFSRLIEQLDKLGVEDSQDSPASSEPAAENSQETRAGDFDYCLVDTPEALAEMTAGLEGVKQLAFDTETTSTQPTRTRLVGISLSAHAGKGWYVPLLGPLGSRTLELEQVREALEEIFTDSQVTKIAHNLKFDLLVLQNAGFTVTGPFFDTMIAAWLLDSDRLTYKLDALSLEYLNHRCIPITDLIGTGRDQVTMDAVDCPTVATYAAEDAEVTLRLAQRLESLCKREGLDELLTELEMPLVPVLARMEQDGVKVDPQRLREMEVELSAAADAIREQILEAAGTQFNPDSPKQLAEILFEKLGLPILKRKKTGPSTDQSVLEELAIEHPLPDLILQYRKLTKLIGTYLKALATCIHPRTGRVHPSFHQTGTSTGRLSCSDPNLQNIPIRTDQGRRIRSAFVAEEGCVLLAADYSQIELRMLAHLCRDETLMAAFREDQDIHRTVASQVFSVPLEEVTPQQRSSAKGVNFGIIYGQTAFGLSKALRIGRGEADEFIRAYKGRFPKIDEFLQACIDQAKTHGYVETLFKRRRKLPEIASRNRQKRLLSERLAINSVVQGSAADLIKIAMTSIDRRLNNKGRACRMLLQIHDELVFEVPADQIDSYRDLIVDEMVHAVELDVPLKVDVGTGGNWLEAK